MPTPVPITLTGEAVEGAGRGGCGEAWARDCQQHPEGGGGRRGGGGAGNGDIGGRQDGPGGVRAACCRVAVLRQLGVALEVAFAPAPGPA